MNLYASGIVFLSRGRPGVQSTRISHPPLPGVRAVTRSGKVSMGLKPRQFHRAGTSTYCRFAQTNVAVQSGGGGRRRKYRAMLGLNQDLPLLLSSILEHGATTFGDTRVVGRYTGESIRY